MKRQLLTYAKRLTPAPVKNSIKGAIGKTLLDRVKSDLETHRCESVSSTHAQKVSIVIPSYNDYDLLRSCIAGITSTCHSLVTEVIVVDDYINPENSRRLASLKSDLVTIIFKSERLGFAGTVNVGLTAANPLNDVVLLNSDTVPLNGWLCNLQKGAYDRDSQIGLVSPMLVYPNGWIQYGGTFHANTIAPQWFAHLYGGASPKRPDANLPFYIRGVSGACLYITRKALNELPQLDDEYWLGFEDVDYAYQAWEKGIRCYYEPSAKVIHHESATRGYSQGVRELSSLRRFWRKWGSPLQVAAKRNSKVVLLHSDRISPIWLEYCQQLPQIMEGQGIELSLLKCDSIRDESAIAEIKSSNARVVIADWGCTETGWLASVGKQRAVMMPYKYDADFIASESELAEKSLGLLRPEFIYVATDSNQGQLLSRSCAWELTATVQPAFNSVRSIQAPESARLGTVSVFADEMTPHKTLEKLEREFSKLGLTGDVFTRTEWTAGLVAARSSEFTLSFVTNEPILSFALLALGKPLVSVTPERQERILMDGFNARTMTHSNLEDITKILCEFKEEPRIAAEYAQNALLSADAVSAQTAINLNAALSAPYVLA